MYKEITLKDIHGGERKVPFLASASTAYRFNQIFHEDLMTKLTKMETEADYAIADKLAFVMNAQAEGKDMKTLNYDSFLAWLDGLESSEVLVHIEEIVGLYLGSKLTSSIAKKE